MKRLIIAVTAFMIGWYVCGFFALQALDYFFPPSFLFFNGWIENVLWPEYLHDIFTHIVFLIFCLWGFALSLQLERLFTMFTMETVITHNGKTYHRISADETTIKNFIRLMSILTICFFVANIISNALFCEYLPICFSILSLISLGMIYGVVFVQKFYGKRR